MKIVLHSLDVLGKNMAGPAIRYWEFAKALSKNNTVTLVSPNHFEAQSESFTVRQASHQTLKEELSNAQVLITQFLSHNLASLAKKHGVRIIIDAYAAMPFENLELFKYLPAYLRTYKNRIALQKQIFSFQMADGIICSNTKQKDLWMGLLLALKKITPAIYDEDPSFKNRIEIIPFGLPSESPQITGNGLRKLFNLKQEDKVLLWAGGIWNWFDPLTLIKAIKQLVAEKFPVHLVFMGLKHPNERTPEMKVSLEAIQLAKDLDLLNKFVFFNYGWTPYHERQNFLLEADIGVSTHSEHIETQYAFRTRILDYIWAGLPIISTTGDSFSEVIERCELGKVVPYGDVEAIVSAVKQILGDSSEKEKMQKNLAKMRSQFYWDTLVKPLSALAEQLTSQPKASLKWKDIALIYSDLHKLYGPYAAFQELALRLYSRKSK